MSRSPLPVFLPQFSSTERGFVKCLFRDGYRGPRGAQLYEWRMRRSTR